MAKKKKDPTTSARIASQAGKDLRDKKTPKKDRGPIASALRQRVKPKGGKKAKGKK